MASLSGQARVQLRNNKLRRDEVLSRYFPRYQPVEIPGNTGLSGASCIIEHQGHRVVLRSQHDPSAPDFHFHRQYRALRKLPASLAPRPAGYYPGWMAVEYLEGATLSTLPDSQMMAGLLYHLHQQPLLGWRVLLLPLLERYWQCSQPQRRTPFWLAQLKTLRQQGEPKPLRLGPLHMDVHAGNLIHSSQGLRLIDWEYAGDGDIALELATLWDDDETPRHDLLVAYAARAHIREPLLMHQVQRWQPWVKLLMTTWYEYRWQQTGDQQFLVLADHSWQRLKHKG